MKLYVVRDEVRYILVYANNEEEAFFLVKGRYPGIGRLTVRLVEFTHCSGMLAEL